MAKKTGTRSETREEPWTRPISIMCTALVAVLVLWGGWDLLHARELLRANAELLAEQERLLR